MAENEILAPAGSLESLTAALNCGADAVYIGGKQFSARQNAANFSNEELKNAAELCHMHGVKLYLTVNTLIFDSQAEEFSEFISYAAECGIDAFIVQDVGAAEIIRKVVPNAHIHGSTQMTVHSVKGAELLKSFGFKRVVLSRELSMKQIEEICAVGIETEVFVHGALCMSVSGQCYLSSLIGQRSANRGFCAQPCRLPFTACGNPEATALSLKDLSLLNHLRKLSEIGVFSFKIEGRMKRPEYVASAVSACRQSLSGQKPDMALLKAVFSRSGFTDGYFTSNYDDMFGKREKEDIIAAKNILPEIRKNYSEERKSGTLNFHVEIKSGEPVMLIASDGKEVVTLSGDIPETALKRPADKEFLVRQLSKLGGTIYNFGNLDADIEDGLSVSAKSLNALRREAAEKLTEMTVQRNSTYQNCLPLEDNFQNTPETLSETRMRISSPEQLNAVSHADYIIIPAEIFHKCSIIEDMSKIIIEPPRFINNENDTVKLLKECRKAGAEHLMCSNIAYLKTGHELGFRLHGDFNLNITNSWSIDFLKKMNVEDTILSFEMKLRQINALKKTVPTGLIVYGYLPAMLTKNCPVKNETGCSNCKKIIYDRTGRGNKIVCHGNYTEILNSQLLYMADRIDDIKNVSFTYYYFTDESPEEIRKILKEYKSGGIKRNNITRGLYYRGVI